MQIDKKISPGQGHAMVSIGGHEVKGQGHMRPSYIWNHGGDIILHPLSRIDKGILYTSIYSTQGVIERQKCCH